MILKHIKVNIALLLVLMCMLSYEAEATVYDNGGYGSYPVSYASEGLNYYLPYPEARLSRLRRGYYYVGDGYVTRVENPALNPALALAPVAIERRDLGVRRVDNNDDNVAARPVQKPKRKKLFVPNLYG